MEENIITDFNSFGFCQEILQGIEEAGFTEPTPIQCQAIRPIMEGHDLIGQALTGTGKTAAFGLPIMNKISGTKGLQFLILVPTRELANQVSDELFRLGKHTGLHTASFIGGQSYSRQEKLLKMGMEILVATPGRLLDLIRSGHFEDIHPKYFVVDEADEMLDMGFIEDVKQIFDYFDNEKQTMLFSATMPKQVIELAQTILKDPIQITVTPKESTNNQIRQFFFLIEEEERTDAIIRLIEAYDVDKAMIFCSTREETDSLNILLGSHGYNVNCLHGDMEQAQRSRVMGAFRRGEFNVLVATDVAARGLDVDDVTHVFNFRLPFDSRGYVHRIGRTGRAGKAGTALTLITPRELRRLEAIRNTVGAQIENQTIPTRHEVNQKKLARLFMTIDSYHLDENLLEQLQILTANRDLLVLLAKLTERILYSNSDKGPEHIGIEGERLDDILNHRRRRRTPGESRAEGKRSGRYRKHDDNPDRPQRGDRDERDGKPGKGDRQERADRPEKTGKQGKGDRPERADRPERTGKPGKSDRPERGIKQERGGKKTNIGKKRPDFPTKGKGSSRKPGAPWYL